MPVKQTLCRLSDIPDGGAIERVATVKSDAVDSLDESLIVTRHGDAVCAYVNVCPHAGRRLDWAPGQFLIEDGYLICAAHGAMFALGSGECVSGPCRGLSLALVEVEVAGGEVRLRE